MCFSFVFIFHLIFFFFFFFLVKSEYKNQKNGEIKDISCLMQDDHKWHLWPSCIKHICQKLVQECCKWHLWPSYMKHVCQILVQ